MDPAHLPYIHQQADTFRRIPAHLQPAAYSDTHPHLATLVSSILHTLTTATAAHTTTSSSSSRLSSLLSQQLSQHYALSLLLHHTQQALTAHQHRFPRLTATLQSADLAYCLHSQGVVGGIAGVTAEEVWSGGGGSGGCGGSTGDVDEYEVREERRRLVSSVEQSMTAQLEAMRAAYEEDESGINQEDSTKQQQQQQEEDGDKENISGSTSSNQLRISHYDSTVPASRPAKPAAQLHPTTLPTSRPVSAAFLALTSPSASHSPDVVALPPRARASTDQLRHRYQQLQRQHVALQLHLLSLHSQLLIDHRLSATLDHDTAQLSCLQAKARCLALKLQLMTAHADLIDDGSGGGSSSGGSGQSDGSGSVWADVLGRLEVMRAEVASEVERVEGARSGYAAVVSGVYGDEWREVNARWRDVQRQRREKQWALKQLAG